MTTRHDAALLIQEGACNLLAIAKSLVTAIEEVRAEAKETGLELESTKDEAVRLILHQMAFLTDIYNLNDSGVEYNRCIDHCRDRSPRVQEQIRKMREVVAALNQTGAAHLTFDQLQPWDDSCQIEFTKVLHYGEQQDHGLKGAIDLRGCCNIRVVAVARNKGETEMKATDYGFCGDPRQIARDFLEQLRELLKSATGNYVGVIVTNDPGLF